MSPSPSVTPAAFVEALSQLRFANTFNPYADQCPIHDLDGAAGIRRANLLSTLEAASAGVDEVWVALEPGHGGARRTGLAMTDERNLVAHAERWGLDPLRPATKSGPAKEQTAGIVWQALDGLQRQIFLWNVFPLHCHQPDRPLSNRRHTRGERAATAGLMVKLLEMLKPARIVGLGQEAHAALAEQDYAFVPVRHPAFGGKAAFMAGVRT